MVLRPTILLGESFKAIKKFRAKNVAEKLSRDETQVSRKFVVVLQFFLTNREEISSERSCQI